MGKIFPGTNSAFHPMRDALKDPNYSPHGSSWPLTSPAPACPTHHVLCQCGWLQNPWRLQLGYFWVFPAEPKVPFMPGKEQADARSSSWTGVCCFKSWCLVVVAACILSTFETKAAVIASDGKNFGPFFGLELISKLMSLLYEMCVLWHDKWNLTGCSGLLFSSP